MTNPFAQFGPSPIGVPAALSAAPVSGRNPFAQFGPPSVPGAVNPLSDVGQTAAASVPRAAADVLGFPADLGVMGAQGLIGAVNAVTGKNYQMPPVDAWMPTSSNIKDWASEATGVNLYNPQTDVGKNLQPWLEAGAAGAIAGPLKAGMSVGGLLLKMGTNAIKYGVAPHAAAGTASTVAGALGASPEVQNYVGLGAGIATGLAGAKTFDSPTPKLTDMGGPSVADLHAASTDEYQAARAANVGLAPSGTQAIADNLVADLGDRMPNRNQPSTAAWVKDIVTGAGQPSDISAIMRIRQGLSEVAGDSVRPDGSVTSDGALAHSVMDSLDNTLQNGLSPADTTGAANPDAALTHWSNAAGSWAKMRQAQAIDNIFTKVQNSGLTNKGDQATALVNQFRTIANNPETLKTYPQPVQDMITDLVRGTNTQRVEKYLSGFDVRLHPWSGTFASFLVNHAADMLGIHGAGFAVPVAGAIATQARNARVIGEAQQISNVVRGAQPVPAPQPVWPPRPQWVPGYAPAVLTAGGVLSDAQKRQQALAQALSAPQ